jgi:hypothetical protein
MLRAWWFSYRVSIAVPMPPNIAGSFVEKKETPTMANNRRRNARRAAI